MSPPDLLPCPVCGAIEDVGVYVCGEQTRVVCDACDISGPSVGDVSAECFGSSTSTAEAQEWTAAEAWNQMRARELLASPDARVAAILQATAAVRRANSQLQKDLWAAKSEAASLRRGAE